jgi:hypothetical protein
VQCAVCSGIGNLTKAIFTSPDFNMLFQRPVLFLIMASKLPGICYCTSIVAASDDILVTRMDSAALLALRPHDGKKLVSTWGLHCLLSLQKYIGRSDAL